jgi:hypothetical protein
MSVDTARLGRVRHFVKVNDISFAGSVNARSRLLWIW